MLISQTRLCVGPTLPLAYRKISEEDEKELQNPESREVLEGGIHETVGMQPDAEHVRSHPRPARYDVSENSHGHDAAGFGESAPASMQDDDVPEHE